MIIFSLVYEKVDLNGFSPSFFMRLLFNTIVIDLEKKFQYLVARGVCILEKLWLAR